MIIFKQLERLAFLISIMLLPMAVQAVPDSVQLHYQPDHPVLQTSLVTIQVSQGEDQAVPDTAQQEVQATLVIEGYDNQEALMQPPLDMSFVLEALKLDTTIKGKEAVFDSKNPGSSLFMKELSKVFNHPIQLTVEKDLNVTAKSKEDLRMLQDVECLGGFQVGNLVLEMLQHLFALAGEELQVGQRYTHQLTLGADQNIPVEMTYKVVGITDHEVRATVKGGFDEVELAKISIGNQAAQGGQTLRLFGNIDGKVVWSRKNALIYKTRVNYRYEGVLVDAEQEIPIKVQLSHQDSTKAI